MTNELTEKKEFTVNKFLIIFIAIANVYLFLSASILIFQEKVNNVDISKANVEIICSKDFSSSLCLSLPILNIVSTKD